MNGLMRSNIISAIETASPDKTTSVGASLGATDIVPVDGDDGRSAPGTSNATETACAQARTTCPTGAQHLDVTVVERDPRVRLGDVPRESLRPRDVVAVDHDLADVVRGHRLHREGNLAEPVDVRSGSAAVTSASVPTLTVICSASVVRFLSVNSSSVSALRFSISAIRAVREPAWTGQRGDTEEQREHRY